MSEKQYKAYIEAIERVDKKMDSSKDFARKVFIKSGILDENGNLTEHYRLPNVHDSAEPDPRVSWL